MSYEKFDQEFGTKVFEDRQTFCDILCGRKMFPSLAGPLAVQFVIFHTFTQTMIPNVYRFSVSLRQDKY